MLVDEFGNRITDGNCIVKGKIAKVNARHPLPTRSACLADYQYFSHPNGHMTAPFVDTIDAGGFFDDL